MGKKKRRRGRNNAQQPPKTLLGAAFDAALTVAEAFSPVWANPYDDDDDDDDGPAGTRSRSRGRIWTPGRTKVVRPTAKQLVPHRGSQEMCHIDGRPWQLPRAPRVYFSPTALAKCDAYVRLADGHNEIAWLGYVKKHGDEIYEVRDCWLFKQEVSGATADIDPIDIAKFGFRMIDEGKPEIKDNLYFWGHLHPGGSTTASHTDETSSQERGENKAPYLIRAICSRQGRMEVTFFDFTRKLRFNDVEWGPPGKPTTRFDEKIKAEIKEKVRTKSYTTTYPNYGAGRYGGNFDGTGRTVGGQPTTVVVTPTPRSAPTILRGNGSAYPNASSQNRRTIVTTNNHKGPTPTNIKPASAGRPAPADKPDGLAVASGETQPDDDEKKGDPAESTKNFFKSLHDRHGPGGEKK